MLLALVNVPPVTAPVSLIRIVPLLVQSGVTEKMPVLPTMIAPVWTGAAVTVSVPLVAVSIPALTSATSSVPKPEIVEPTGLVRPAVLR